MTWVMLTKRTEDPKLAWLEKQLTEAGIEHRRRGESFHAPILEVQQADAPDAWRILSPIDGLEDDEPFWTEDPDGCSCGPPGDGFCSFCRVRQEVTEIQQRRTEKQNRH